MLPLSVIYSFAVLVGGSQSNSLYIDVFVGVIVLAFVINAVYLRSFRKFTKHLRDTHPRNAQLFNASIGASTMNPSKKNLMMIYKYFWSRQYESLNDATLNSLGSRTRALLVCSVTLTMLLFLALVVHTIIH